MTALTAPLRRAIIEIGDNQGRIEITQRRQIQVGEFISELPAITILRLVILGYLASVDNTHLLLTQRGGEEYTRLSTHSKMRRRGE